MTGKLDRAAFDQTGETVDIAFLLVPQFTLTSFAAAVDCLRAANRVAERPLFTWCLLSENGAPVSSSADIEVPVDQALGQDDDWDVLIVCAGFRPEKAETKAVLSYLRRQARFGTLLGGIESGAQILAAAKLLNDQECTIHWELFDGFVQRFPDVRAVRRLFTLSDRFFTCSGHLAVMDLMVALLSRWLTGNELRRLSNLFMHDIRRSTGEEPRQFTAQELSTVHSDKVLKAIDFMHDNMESIVNRSEIAEHVGVSLRQLERLFRRHLGMTPAIYYKQLRLRRAQQLIHYSSASITEIAIICGFVSMSHFSKSYREYFGVSPKLSREIGPAIGGGHQVRRLIDA